MKCRSVSDAICVGNHGSSRRLFTAYSPDIGITLATEACREKSNEIMAVLAHGRIETRTYHAYEGLKLIADKEK